jgi:hypothetical protein
LLLGWIYALDRYWRDCLMYIRPPLLLFRVPPCGVRILASWLDIRS